MTKPHILAISAIPLALLGLTGACGNNDVDQPKDEDYTDIAQSIAPLIRIDVAGDGSAVLSTQLSTGEHPAWLSFEADGSAQGAAGGLTWSVALSCKGADNVALEACDETVAAAEVASSVHGTLRLPNYSADLDAGLDWSISGLQGEQVAVAGRSRIDASSEFTGLLHPVKRSFKLSYDGTYDLVVTRDNGHVVSGSIAASVDVRRIVAGTRNDSDAHFQVDVDVKLDGSNTASIVIDGEVAFQLRLDTGALVRVDVAAGG